MRFNSVIYWLFLALVFGGFWLIPKNARKGWLLGASYLFYASWHWPYLGLLIGAAALNHLGAKWIIAAQNRSRRGAVVIAANLLLLAAFKYLGWLSANANGLLALLGLPVELPVPRWVLPLGISFYLFECMSYVIDVVRKREKLHSFWDFQLFVAFFPKLIAGPILRAKELLPQLGKLERPNHDQIIDALRMILTGLFLKVVVADSLVEPLDKAFARSTDVLGGTDAWMMGIGFGLQIYLDFSSYSRIAIGSAQLLGIKLVENFNHPYAATSPADFWARWHMSLSRWIRDYLFYPLVGKKSTLFTLCRAAIVSMVLCGIWHGAGWNFALWGLFHGLMIAGYHVLTHGKRAQQQQKPSAWVPIAGNLATFLLVCLAWLLFRATNVEQALALITRAAVPFLYPMRALSGTFYLQVTLLAAVVLLAPRIAAWSAPLADRPRFQAIGEGVFGGLLIALILVYLRGQTAFIYFQF